MNVGEKMLSVRSDFARLESLPYGALLRRERLAGSPALQRSAALVFRAWPQNAR